MAEVKPTEEIKERPYQGYPVTPEPAFNLDVKDILSLALRRWYLIVLSIAVCLVCANLYLKITPPIYLSQAELKLRSTKNDNNLIDLSQLGINTPQHQVSNELFILESPLLMTDVVNRLSLNNTYNTKDGLRPIDLYKSSPVIVTPADTISTPSYSFVVALDGHKNFVLKDFVGSEKDDFEGIEVKGSLGQTVKTPLGNFTISVSPWYNASPYKANEIKYAHIPVEDAAQKYAHNVIASSAQSDTDIFRIYDRDTSRQRAIDIVNTLIEVYRDRDIAEQLNKAQSANEFIAKRLAILEDDLSNVDGDISSYKSSNQLPDVTMSSSLYFNKSFENKQDILNVHAQLQMAEFVRRELKSANIDNALPVNTGLDQAGIQSQITEYNNIVLERNRLLATGSESNPIISDLTSTLKTMKNNMVRSLDNYITSLKQQMGNLETTDSKAASELTANPNREKYLLSVERQQKVKESLYIYLLQKREESELSQAYIEPGFSIVAETMAPKSPESPDHSRIYLIAFAIGFAIPIVILVLMEAFNTTVRSRDDLKSVSVPLLGEIPFDKTHYSPFRWLKKHAAAGPKDVLVVEGSNNAINEAFRAIRTSLEFMVTNTGYRGRVIAITSALAGSGKTFTAMNLARTLAIGGKKVVVIDLDLRKAALSKWVGRTDRGISNYLIGQASFSDVVVHGTGDNKGLDIVPVGIIPPNPVELLSQQCLPELLNKLREDYDYIIIDCPPAEIVADTRIISGYCDMTLFIIRAGLYQRAMLSELDMWAETGRYKNLALLLNASTETARSKYNHSYYEKK